MDLKDRVEAACRTINELQEHGLEVEPDDIDNDVAATLAVAYAKKMLSTPPNKSRMPAPLR